MMRFIKASINTIAGCLVFGSLAILFKIGNLIEELTTVFVAMVFWTVFKLADVDEKWSRYRNKQAQL
jgi:hypothetical protein